MTNNHNDHYHHLLLAKKMILKYMVNIYNYNYNRYITYQIIQRKEKYIELHLK